MADNEVTQELSVPESAPMEMEPVLVRKYRCMGWNERRALIKAARTDPSKMEQMRCNPMENRLCLYYATTLDWFSAMKLAGYGRRANCKTDSPLYRMRMQQKAHIILRRPWVKKRLEEVLREYDQQIEMANVELLGSISNVARANVLDFMKVAADQKNLEMDFSGLTREQAEAIQEVEVEEKTRKGPDGKPMTVRKTRVKMHSKAHAHDMLMKKKGLYAKDTGSENGGRTLNVVVFGQGSAIPVTSTVMEKALPENDGQG